MINIKTEREIELMREAGKIVGETHKYLEKFIKPGIRAIELDSFAEDFIKSKNALPSFKNYNGFPNSICVSINDEVVHGIPSKRKLKDGDIVSIDIGACYKGYHGDSAWTYIVGKTDTKTENLLKYTLESLELGIKEVKPGNRIGDISKAIYDHAKKHNLGVVKELVGHGVGSKLHEEPNVPNFTSKEKGPLLKIGMTIAIEPMLNLGTEEVYLLDNDWTIITGDGKNSAHFEHTVLVTKDGCEILTKR